MSQFPLSPEQVAEEIKENWRQHSPARYREHRKQGTLDLVVNDKARMICDLAALYEKAGDQLPEAWDRAYREVVLGS